MKLLKTVRWCSALVNCSLTLLVFHEILISLMREEMLRCVLCVLILFTISLPTFSSPKFSEKSICGLFDDRRPSFNPKVGRVLRPGDRNGCSITLIGKTCAISAGHCHERLEKVEFNVPLSDANGKIRPSDPSDVYPVDKETIVFQYEGKGSDWSVFRLKKILFLIIFPVSDLDIYPFLSLLQKSEIK